MILSGFTLIELLVVIAIIGVLASLLLPTLSRTKEQARITQCLNNMRQVGLGIIMYTDDYGYKFPPAFIENTNSPSEPYIVSPCIGGKDSRPGLCEALMLPAVKRPLYPYLKPSEIFRCPVDTGQRAFT